MKINDGQLDEANRRIAELERSLRAVQEVCARRLELLKKVAECRIADDSSGRVDVRLPAYVFADIYDETDENEVQP